MERLRFRVIGPTEVRVDGVVVPLRAKRLRSLLTTLLVEANRVVGPDALIEALWAGEPPAGPERALHTAVSRLRTALGPAAEVVRTVPGGYLIEVRDEQLDLTEFRSLVLRADGVDDPRERARLLTQALGLWHEVPLAGGSAVESIQSRPWLILDRLRAMELLIEARLVLGEHAAVIAELTVLTKEHPLRERLWVQLMLALYRSGRQGEALAAYRELTAVLAEELGVEPAAEVRSLHQAILKGEVPAGKAAAPAQSAENGWRTHWQLPMDLSDFVGREQLADELTTRLDNRGAMPVVVVSGPPGVGKSALSVHIGHRLRANFPDGHWHVRLAGASASPREPSDVLAELLGLAGLEPQAIPEELDPRAALLRSTLADRRVLLVLDDARDARQVLPLLPGTAGNAVLITSRNELTALTVSVGARGTRLAMLDPAEATSLLSGMLGAERVASEPAAAADLAEICGRLPLALRIAAGLLRGHPDQPIAEYAEELRTGDRLGSLVIDDEPDTAVAAAFALSYESLDLPVRRLFTLLGVIPGGDFTAPAAAALLDCPARDAGRLLDFLVSANLVQRERGRYRMHDLIRLYAAGRAKADPEAGPAWRRLADWYLRTADAAVDHAYRAHVRLTARFFDVNPFDDEAQAGSWLEAEELNLIAMIERAADLGPCETGWQTADVLRQYFARIRRIDPWRRSAEAGARAARVSAAAGDRSGLGAMHHSLGVLYFATGHLDQALAEYTAGSVCYAEIGFRLGEAALVCNLGMVYLQMGDLTPAVDHQERGLDILRSLGQTTRLVPSLHSLSDAYRNLGNLAGALAAAEESWINEEPYQRSVSLMNRGATYRLLGELVAAEADLTEAIAMIPRPSVAGYYELALLYADLGRTAEAVDEAAFALEVSQREGLEWHEAVARNVLGAAYTLVGRCDEAIEHHLAARDIAVRLVHHSTVVESWLGLAAAALAGDDLRAALDHGNQAMTMAAELKLRIAEARTGRLLAEAHRRSGHLGVAAELETRVAEIVASSGFRPAVRIG
ncbi:AfsR/SARP family transcriptional regulator [Kribbella sp. CA-293567]|uniref:AfsR/SARP family transcriptional regulator n=1 Tax=Kribbella sp. CA-293567 TaxID=3002436 RepID=UPI0022DDE2F3|nr:BTAD domain-containing putative transcriptional regulator [Kribbella sp. CA-293567]WBQ02448.1 BTAD domain-containing putative transcriptional regulator [Kribbella sp. CA-293567]